MFEKRARIALVYVVRSLSLLVEVSLESLRIPRNTVGGCSGKILNLPDRYHGGSSLASDAEASEWR